MTQRGRPGEGKGFRESMLLQTPYQRKKPADKSFDLSAGSCFDPSAAKWSRWEKRVSLSVLLHEPLIDLGEP